DFDTVLRVHLYGTAHVCKAAWSRMRDAGYGRIVNTTSSSGLFGNFGQANYAAAKMGLVGLTKTLAQEGAKYHIKCNAIAPVARSRMTDAILPPDALARLDPECVAPLVAYLCSESLNESGQVYSAGAGYVSRV